MDILVVRLRPEAKGISIRSSIGREGGRLGLIADEEVIIYHSIYRAIGSGVL